MLVNDKFIYLSIPRCASTSFHLTCIRKGLDIKFANHELNTKIDFDINQISNIDLVYKIKHVHEQLVTIKDIFGYNYPVISVKRNKYERYLSYFNHVLGELVRAEKFNLYEKLKEITTEQLLSYTKDDITDKHTIHQFIPKFFKKLNINEDYPNKLNKIFMPLFAPTSYYHANHENIKWFDFENLNELEEWVSNKLKIDFKLENFGSSKKYESSIKIDQNFKDLYDSIYITYENPKKQKTII